MTSRTLEKLTSADNVNPMFFLKTCCLLDVVLHKEAEDGIKTIVSACEDVTIYEANKIMKEKDVKTLIIHRMKDGRKRYSAIVTTLDILTWFCWKRKNALTHDIPVSKLAGVTKETKSLFISPITMNLDSVVQPFIQGVHALVVKRKKENPRYVFISQYDILNFIYKHYKLIVEAKDFFHTSLRDSGIKERLSQAFTIKASCPVRKGFEIITKKEIGGLAVVNSEGNFVSNLAAKHSRELFDEEKEKLSLSQTVEEFVKIAGEPFGDEVANKVHENMKVIQIIQRFVQKRFRRVFLCDADSKPKLVITLSDLIREVVLNDFYKDQDTETSSGDRD